MNVLGTNLSPFFAWLLRATLQGSFLVCLILLIKLVLRNRLPARWHYVLWLVLLVRLSLPWAPQSRLSIYNLLENPQWARPVARDVSAVGSESGPQGVPDVSHAAPQQVGPEGGASESSRAAEPLSPAPAAPLPGESVPIEGYWRFADAAGVLPVFWLIGSVVFAGYVLARNMALWRAIRRERPVTDQETLDALEDGKMQMGVQTIVGLVVTDRIKSPALFGYVRPRILLPEGLLEALSLDELQYVFLHELAHLKRRDIYLAWLVCLLQVLHWFNPLIWLAFRRMRADQEMACDALALSRMTAEGPAAYGRTIVRLLERFSQPRYFPSVAGILEEPSNVERRMTMIAKFKSNSYRWSPLALVLLVLLACVTLVNARQDAATQNPASPTSAGEPAQRPVFQQVRIPNKIPSDAMLSPDGKNILFASEDRLWIMAVQGKSASDYPGAPRLVDTGEMKVMVMFPGLAWSGDGRWIAFKSMKDDPQGNTQLCVVPVEGRKPKVVRESRRDEIPFNYRLSLSPDGQTLAFSSVDANELHIYTVAVEGGTPKRLVEATASEPVFSPDGKRIAYVEDQFLGRKGGGLWVVPAEGGVSKRVADAACATNPVWSPDGRMIAFLDLNNPTATTKQIHIVLVDGEEGTPAKKTTIDCPQRVDFVFRLTGWTPDNRIGALFKGHLEFGLFTIPVKGGATTCVAPGTFAEHPRWTPDGRRIVYSNNLQGITSGWTYWGTAWIPAEGGEATVVPVELDTKIGKPSLGTGNHVSPDGKTIVFSGRRPGEGEGTMISHIWTIPLDGGKPTQLTIAPASFSDFFPCWSPDGESVAFVRAKSPGGMVEALKEAFKEANIYIIPSQGGQPRPLTSESDAMVFGFVAWSPDGKLVAFLSADEERSKDSLRLKVIPAEGGESRVVGKMEAINGQIELAWSPDSKRIACNGPDGKTIKIMSLADGSTVDLAPDLVNARIWHLDWSHDGQRLVFAGRQGTTDSEFWMMDNFLPDTAATSPEAK
jgi:beta-lactamase regulating signal transducer with metallopeptidase domain/Tol biopolymer transport system component